jgi:hypothetical protein
MGCPSRPSPLPPPSPWGDHVATLDNNDGEGKETRPLPWFRMIALAATLTWLASLAL